MNGNWWVVEIDQGGTNWTPIAYCAIEKQADELAKAAHVEAFGRSARTRQYGVPSSGPAEK